MNLWIEDFLQNGIGTCCGNSRAFGCSLGFGCKKMQTNFKKDNSRFATNADEDEVKVIQSKRFYKQPCKKAQGKCTSILFLPTCILLLAIFLK